MTLFRHTRLREALRSEGMGNSGDDPSPVTARGQTQAQIAPSGVENEPPRVAQVAAASDAEPDGHAGEAVEPQGAAPSPSDVVAAGLRRAAPNRPAGKPGRSGPPGNTNARTHGSSRVAADLKELVRRSMDGRTTEAREVAEWIEDYARDLGGVDNLTTGQRTLLQAAGHTVLQLGRVDAFIATMPSMIHAKRRQLYPVVVQRAALVNTLKGLLGELGLERRAKDVTGLRGFAPDDEAEA